MVKSLAIALTVSTLLMAPIWVQHLTAPDGGLVAIGGGKLTEVDVIGDGTKKNKGMHPIVFHLCAIAGVAHFTLSFMAIAAAAFGDATIKKIITGIYVVWVSMIMVVQYTHPWTGSVPQSLFEMPQPLVYVIATLCALGLAFDSDKPKKA